MTFNEKHFDKLKKSADKLGEAMKHDSTERDGVIEAAKEKLRFGRYSPDVEISDEEREQINAMRDAFLEARVGDPMPLVEHIALAFVQGCVAMRNQMLASQPDAERAQTTWTTTKPDYACVFVGRNGDDFGVWQFDWNMGESPEDSADESFHYYLAWLTDDGDEWDSVDDCAFEEYLVLKVLPTLEQTNF